MKISTEIHSAAKHVGEERAVELYAKAGFDCFDFSMFNMARMDWKTNSVIDAPHPLCSSEYLAFARRLRRIGEDNGICCNQSHAPFPTRHPGVASYVRRAIECTAEAGGQICIIHPDNYDPDEKNAEMYHELLPFAKSCGVKIATENMWNWDDAEDHALVCACSTPERFNHLLDLVDDPDLVACLDIGHAEMRGLGTSAPEMIRALGPRLKALHIHDNDLHYDSHQIPFSMQIDFAPIAKALKEVKYDGVFTLEADQYLSKYTPENVFEGMKKMADAAHRLVSMYESF